MSVDIVDKNLCCGCSACEQICPFSAIYMSYDDEGFYVPSISKEKCTDCNLCEKVCVSINNYMKSPVKHAYGAKHIDSNIHKSSQSGGAFMGIAQSIIEENGVVYGAALQDDFKTGHIRVDKKSDLHKIQGTKYVQSALGDTYKNIEQDIKSGKKVLFSGLPCQVGGLKRYIKYRNTLDCNLYTCDLICFGVPSPKIFSEWINCLQKTYSDELKQVWFRDIDTEWGKGKEKYIFKSGTIIESTFYTDLYFGHYIDNKSCHTCKFCSTERAGDITIGDFWGIEKIDKLFYDNRGVSAVLVNTDKGMELYKRLSDKMITAEYVLEDVCAFQPGLHGRVYRPNRQREAFWNKYKSFGIKYIAQEKEAIKIDLSYKIFFRLSKLHNKFKKAFKK